MCSSSKRLKLLLINPRSPESFWSFRWAIDSVLPEKRAVNTPLGLATVAALCPSDWDVEIVDENIESVPLAPDADLIGVGGMGVQFARQKELLTYYRANGYYTIAGGSFASLCPEEYESIADTVVAGEAERIFPRFCADFEAGAPLPLYRETGEIALTESPVPRFDLLRLDRYSMVSVQFSRGCPFQCEFCDIIVMFGRKPRTKPVEQILGELGELRRLGAKNVFFVDDNFIGNKPSARELLRALGAWQREHGAPFRFGTEASLNLAQDRELLALLRDANFQWVFLGIESPDPASLREAGKLQNTREDMLVSIHRIYEHGIDVFGGFIVGFDHDTTRTFDAHYDFIMESGIQLAMVGLLTAIPRTPLHARMAREGRLLTDRDHSDNTHLGSNIVPKQMTVESMVAAYRRLYQRLSTDRAIARRIRNKSRHLAPVKDRTGYSLRESVRILWRFARRGLMRASATRTLHVARTVLLARVQSIPAVIADWIAALSIRDYAERHLFARESEPAKLSRRAGALMHRLDRYIHSGSIEVSFDRLMTQVSLRVASQVDRAFFRRASRELRRILRESGCTVALVIEYFDARNDRALRRLLRRLGAYADRVSVSVSDALRDVVQIDSSRFHLVLGRDVTIRTAS